MIKFLESPEVLTATVFMYTCTRTHISTHTDTLRPLRPPEASGRQPGLTTFLPNPGVPIQAWRSRSRSRPGHDQASDAEDPAKTQRGPSQDPAAVSRGSPGSRALCEQGQDWARQASCSRATTKERPTLPACQARVVRLRPAAGRVARPQAQDPPSWECPPRQHLLVGDEEALPQVTQPLTVTLKPALCQASCTHCGGSMGCIRTVLLTQGGLFEVQEEKQVIYSEAPLSSDPSKRHVGHVTSPL